MKNWHLCALLAVSIPSIAAATDEIEFQSTGVSNMTTSADSFGSTNFNGWVISATGSSGSPGLIPAFNLQVNATCITGACLTTPLDVFYTVTNFTTVAPANTLQTNFTAQQTAGESSRAITWADSLNGEFGGGLPAVPADHLGTVTVTTALGSGSAIGNPAEGPTPYSMTVEEIFTDSTGGVAAFNASANISSAPEIDPASAMGGLTLLAGGLAVLRGRRRKK